MTKKDKQFLRDKQWVVNKVREELATGAYRDTCTQAEIRQIRRDLKTAERAILTAKEKV